MTHHKNARLTFAGRRILVSRIIHEGLPVREADSASLPVQEVSAGAEVAGHPAQDHAALYPEGEREGGALHPHPAE